MAVPAGAYLSTFRAFAAPLERLVTITAIKAMQLDNVGDGCLIRIETDAGLVGHGEAGCDSRMARARLDRMRPILIGQDPLAIERLFYQMTAPQNPFVPAVGLVSGIDIALWDLAGKILGQPIHRLLGGPIRPEAPLYAHGRLTNMLDPVEARDWAEKVKAAPEGFRTFKFGVGIGERSAGSPWAATADG
jgi:galactonate dehydratase